VLPERRYRNWNQRNEPERRTMIETAVLFLFLLAMLTLAAALWGLTTQAAGSVSDSRGSMAGKRG
jgi:hypothetical protein